MATLHRGFSPSSILVLLLLLLVAISSASPVHEILSKYGFPPGLFPDAAKHYALSPHGDFVVALDNPCYVQLTEIFYYEKIISGKLEFGRISDLSGIQVKKLFAWFPITGIVSPPNKGYVELQAIGIISEKYPVKMFEEIPSCVGLCLAKILVSRV
ncbi:hypothetical protein J5N97_011027 [Dioscorea zingiberensis]|uniref:Uncharacterized protein n=1 Tax=Dioscorea zingiberensis TaxID=325984 RepID=A0A9D5HP66_9LILI|nr:hypothetical protein J5N97_011027 [Dioscorea zingiberensis]